MILIIGAMQEEVNALTEHMSDTMIHDVSGITTHQGLISGERVIVAQSGVGKVNAAYTTATLIHKYNPTHVLNIGSAGGLLPGQKVGDIVIATSLQYHDLDIGPNTHTDPRFIFYTDEKLVALANQSVHLTHHQGLIVTGDQFITKEQKQFSVIQNTFPHAICVEMEAAAIAAVCAKTETPFLVLRSLSDVVLNDGNDLTFDEYLPLASKNSAQICVNLINRL